MVGKERLAPFLTPDIFKLRTHLNYMAVLFIDTGKFSQYSAIFLNFFVVIKQQGGLGL